MMEVKKKMGYVYSNFSVSVRESPCNHLCFYQELDEELEKELEEESENEEIEYIEADSDLEAELESESDVEDIQVNSTESTNLIGGNIRRKPRLEIEYETEKTSYKKIT